MALPSRTLQTSREQQRAGRQVKDGTRGALSFREREKREIYRKVTHASDTHEVANVIQHH